MKVEEVARLGLPWGLPVTYVMVALAIVVPGILNILAEAKDIIKETRSYRTTKAVVESLSLLKWVKVIIMCVRKAFITKADALSKEI